MYLNKIAINFFYCKKIDENFLLFLKKNDKFSRCGYEYFFRVSYGGSFLYQNIAPQII